METSKVKEIKEVKEWGEGDRKTYYHNLVMDNGSKINIGKKKQLSIGDELTYEITGDNQQEFRKAKSAQKEFSKGGYQKPDQDAILYQVALKGVMDFYNTHTDLSYKENHFNPTDINKLAFEIAKMAKAGISKLKES